MFPAVRSEFVSWAGTAGRDGADGRLITTCRLPTGSSDLLGGRNRWRSKALSVSQRLLIASRFEAVLEALNRLKAWLPAEHQHRAALDEMIEELLAMAEDLMTGSPDGPGGGD